MPSATVIAVESVVRDPQYAPYADGPGGPFRWRLALRPLDLADWIELGDHYERDVTLKREVQARHPGTVFAAMPEAVDGCAEVRDAIVDHLATRFPEDFARDGDGLVNRRLDERVLIDDPDRHPLEVAARLVQEDLIVMVEAPELVFAAGSVCFPNRWDLASKLGKSLVEVHEPVSQLNEQLGEPIAKFFERLTPAKSFWRLGWGVLDTDDLYQPLDGTAAPRSGRVGLDDLVVRIERETLRRFPRTGAVLFTIRTYTRPLRDVAAGEPMNRLLEALATMPDDIAAYKQLEGIRPALAGLLDG